MPTIPLNLPAFLSEWLALRMAKKNWHAVIFVHKNGISIPPGHTPEAAFSGNENSFFYTLLGWVPIVLSALLCINRALFLRFHQHLAGGFRERIEKHAVVARRNRLLSCNSETV